MVKIPKKVSEIEVKQVKKIVDLLSSLSDEDKAWLGSMSILGGSVFNVWLYFRLKYQRELNKALKEGDTDKVREIKNKINKLNKASLMLGSLVSIGGGLGIRKLSGFVESGQKE